jgi:hypothetical protein
MSWLDTADPGTLKALDLRAFRRRDVIALGDGQNTTRAQTRNRQHNELR